ncbi:MAG: rhodanese-like domain-containing protein [Burkholderiales bacterium]
MAEPKMTPHQIDEKLQHGEKVQFIDSRNPKAWREAPTKLPGALRVPVDEPGNIGNVPHDRLVVTYCT